MPSSRRTKSEYSDYEGDVEGSAHSPQTVTITNALNGKKYEISKRLGKGGWGITYLCYDYKHRTRALKVERDTALVYEIAILQEAKKHKCIHIAKMYDHGNCPEFDEPFIVMECFGKNVADIKKNLPGKIFSKGTALRVLMQALDGIKELHMVGYISRDIKPSNFCVGRNSVAPKSIYIIDFGVARNFTKDNEKTVINEYSPSAWKGTAKYCPIANHMYQKQCRRDDVESWFYMALELLEGKLPWNSINRKSRTIIEEHKKLLRDPGCEYFVKSPPFFQEILLTIDKWKFLERPKYSYIYKLFSDEVEKIGLKFSDPYDWESGIINDIKEVNTEVLTSEDNNNKNNKVQIK
uniref:Protein kinase domain-containing protein n=1 Tax=Parastrongyloides trichosuri TaxID=131310 RepID=A0A0N4Z8R7_PARTI